MSGRGAVVWRWADSEPEASEDSCLLSAPPERLLLVLTSLPACPPTPPPRQPTAEMRIKYFDTIPTAASVCLMRKGFLFAASEFGDHALYNLLVRAFLRQRSCSSQLSSTHSRQQPRDDLASMLPNHTPSPQPDLPHWPLPARLPACAQDLGDDDAEAVESSSSTLQETEEGFQPVFFDPRPLKNLEPLDRLDSLAPICDMKVANLASEEIPQIYAACGRGSRSTLRVLRPGLAVTGAGQDGLSPLGVVAPLPSNLSVRADCPLACFPPSPTLPLPCPARSLQRWRCRRCQATPPRCGPSSAPLPTTSTLTSSSPSPMPRWF